MPEAALSSLMDEVGQEITLELLKVQQPGFDQRRKEFTGPPAYAPPVLDRALVSVLSSDDEPVRAGRLSAGSLQLKIKASWNRSEVWPESTSQDETYVVGDDLDALAEEDRIEVLIETLFGVQASLENARVTYDGESYVVTEAIVRRHGTDTVWIDVFAEVRNRA